MLNKEKLEERLLEKSLESAKRWEYTAPQVPVIKKKLLQIGSAAVNTSKQLDYYNKREINRVLFNKANILASIDNFSKARIDIFDERMMGGTLDWLRIPPDETAAKTGRAVCRIVNLPETSEVINAVGFGTGFLVSPQLILTNHHVLPNVSETEGVGANFENDYLAEGGYKIGQIFELDPDTFFLSDEDLDFALIAVKPQNESGKSIASYGFIPLIPTKGKILVGHPVNIIQHPEGTPKTYATRQNLLLKIFEPGNYLQYETDTLRGSSGSPAFNTLWEAVGLHHSSIPLILDGKIRNRSGDVWIKGQMDVEDIHWVANEAIRVSSIVNFLTGYYSEIEDKSSRKAQLLAEFLELARDPLAAKDSRQITGKFESGSADFNKQNIQEKLSQMSSVTINITGTANIYINSTEPTPAIETKSSSISPSTDVADASSSHRVSDHLEKSSIRFDPDKTFANRKGYDSNFLDGFNIPVPGIADNRKDEILKESGNEGILKYHHFSLVMNESRKFLMWAASNADYNDFRRDARGRDAFGQDRWIKDNRIREHQIDSDDFYVPAIDMDRGHNVRREDSAWGDTAEEIEYSNSDTFHFTNCTPQHMKFNQSKYKGLWGMLENHITTQIEAADKRAIIYAGPVLSASDPAVDFGQGKIQYPLRFWKVIIAVSKNNADRLEAYGFVLDQTNVIPASGIVPKIGREKMNFDDFEIYQKKLSYITDISGVTFPEIVRQSDVLRNTNSDGRESFDKNKDGIKLNDISDVRIH